MPAYFVDLTRCRANTANAVSPSPSSPDTTAAARRPPFPFSFSLFPTFGFRRMLRPLSLLFSSLVLLSAHPITDNTQTIIIDKSSPEYQGWFDPRVNGGRFLDVRTHFNDVYKVIQPVTDLLSDAVHEPQASVPRRTSEHHHHRPL